jgi:hypothetical protein
MILVEPHVARGATVGLDAHAHRLIRSSPQSEPCQVALGWELGARPWVSRTGVPCGTPASDEAQFFAVGVVMPARASLRCRSMAR